MTSECRTSDMGTSDFESFHGWACPWTPLESSRLRQARKSPASFSLELDISVIVGEEIFNGYMLR